MVLQPIPLTRDEIRALWLDKTKEELMADQGVDNEGHIRFPKKANERTLGMIKAGCTIDMPGYKIARIAGIHYDTLSSWMNDYGEWSKAFSEIFELWSDMMEIAAKIKMQEKIDSGDSKIIMEVVKAKDKRYDLNKESTSGNVNHIMNVFIGVTEQAEDFILSRHRGATSPKKIEQEPNSLESPAETTYLPTQNS